MKILQIAQKPQRRGAEVFVHQLSQELRHCGFTVNTVYLYPTHDAVSLPLAKGDKILASNEQHPFEVFPSVQLQPFRTLLQYIDDFQPDIIQVNGGRSVKYGALINLWRAKRPWVLIYRNIGHPRDWVQGAWRTFFYRHIVVPKIDGIVGVSQTTLQVVNQFYKLSIPTRYIPRAISPTALQVRVTCSEMRHRLETPVDAQVILYVGSLSAEKRIDRLLRIFAKVQTHQPNLQLWLVGGGAKATALKKQATELGLEQSVLFLGVQENVADYMAAADLLVLTSDTEGIPGVLLEAGFLSLPVVATAVGGVAECVVHEKTGLLVKPNDEDGFADAVVRLLRDPVRREQMGNTANSWVQDNFMMARVVQQYTDFYREVLTRAQQP